MMKNYTKYLDEALNEFYKQKKVQREKEQLEFAEEFWSRLKPGKNTTKPSKPEKRNSTQMSLPTPIRKEDE